jgi:hypothetical protein
VTYLVDFDGRPIVGLDDLGVGLLWRGFNPIIVSTATVFPLIESLDTCAGSKIWISARDGSRILDVLLSNGVGSQKLIVFLWVCSSGNARTGFATLSLHAGSLARFWRWCFSLPLTKGFFIVREFEKDKSVIRKTK